MKKLYCALFGHNYKVSKNVTYHVKEYQCKNCKTERTIDGDGKFIPLTPKFKEINTVLNHVHNKRLEKGQKVFMIDL
ncbi:MULTISPECIES: DUF1660 family phage protein [Winogradskyella]|uniref:DUF1660 family phage protein n=1 Tax=Winogradskyella TaxID=286104 RepID=UPI0015C9EA4D|nr:MULTISPECIES: DUF1660 family phage protein [Winogradskyella]QXP80456.1 hypothetical protein H0I32_07505 [Winogradskyella sp. HaHa_3_26]